MKGVKFTPETVTIKAGETVEWSFNDGQTEHQVKGATFESEVQSTGTFTHTFDQAGTSTYQCTIHPEQMKGIVVVQ